MCIFLLSLVCIFFMLFSYDLFFLLPEVFWTMTGVSLLIFSTVLTNNHRVILITRIGYMFIFFVFCLLTLVISSPTVDYALLNYQYVSELLTFFTKLFFLFLLAIWLFVTLNYCLLERIFFVEYYFLVNFFCVSSFLLISSNDLILFYLAIELQSLILYTFAALKRYNIFSAESGLKYFVLGALSSGLLLFGISLFYGFLGSLNFFEIKFLFLGWFDLSMYYAILLAALLLLSSVLFKLSAAPFHVWVPDVYEGAPSAIVLLFATLPKAVVIAFLVKLFVGFLYECGFAVYSALFFSGLISVIVGTLLALKQLNIKRLYAYSAVVNVGYLMTALSYGTVESFLVLFNYLVVYMVSAFVLFGTLFLYRNVGDLRKTKQLVEYSVFTTQSIVLAILLSFGLFSLAGIPPMAGFFVKFFMFKSIFMSDFMLNPAVFIILLSSVASAFYYLRVVRFLFFGSLRKPALFIRTNYACVAFFVVTCLFLLLFALFQTSVLVGVECLICDLYL